MSLCRCASDAPYSARLNPPNRGVPSTTVISLLRRSPCEICWLCRTANASHNRATGVWSAHSSIGTPRAGRCAYSVHPRSRADTAIGVVLASPTSSTAIAISARCSIARRIEVCSGAVSLSRSRSLRQNCRRTPPPR